MDRKRYTPGDQVLHPGTGRTERYQDANGAVFSETRHDAHGNKFSTHYSLDSATRYGYTIYGGQAPRRHRRHAQTWNPRPNPQYNGSNVADRISAATSQMTGNYRSTESDGAAMGLVLILMLLLVSLPLGIAYLMRRRTGTMTTTAIVIALAEPAWLLLLWSWLANGVLWPAVVAFLIPAGYALYVRYQRQNESQNRPQNP